MKLFDAVRKILKEPAATSVKLAEALATARTVEAEARAESTRLSETRASLLGDDAALAKNREAIRACVERVEDTALFAAEIEKRLRAAEHTEEQARRLETYESARKQFAQADALIPQYVSSAKAILLIVQKLATAQLAIRAANENLPDGAAPLPDPEDAWTHQTDAIPRKDLSSEILELWVNSLTGRPLSDEDQKRVHPDPDGRGGTIHTPGARSTGGIPVRLQRLNRIEYLPQQFITWREPITAGLTLPGFVKAPLYPYFPSDPSVTLATIKDALAAVEDATHATRSPSRQPVVEYVLAPANAAITKAMPKREFREGRSKYATKTAPTTIGRVTTVGRR